MQAGDSGTPLTYAARHGRAADVAALLAAGADVNEPRADGATPLYVACQKGHTANADVNKAMGDGRTPLYVAYPCVFSDRSRE